MVKKMLKKIISKLINFVIGEYLPCYVISRSPLIIITYWEDFQRYRAVFQKSLTSGQNIHVLCQLGWQYEDENRVASTAADVKNLTAATPHIKFTFLCNSVIEEQNFKHHNLNGILCHQNAFLDENRYKVIPDAVKEYDAIYIARITPFKRHLLAAEIPSLRLIGDYYDSESEHVDMVMKGLPRAIWKRKAFAFNVYKEMNRARTGLCLSAEEGAMFVSAEYLLCGLPLVSTRNKGGRDTIFTKEHVYTAEDTPESVAAGVKEMIKKNIPPQEIRNAVLEKMAEHRKIFIRIIQDIYAAEGTKRNFQSEWSKTFIHKMGIRCTVLPWLKLTRGLKVGK
jgi:glycosyltransferase involved in cell wall biosynthesis